MIRDFLGLDNCDFQIVDLTRSEGRSPVASVDVLLAFAVYGYFTDRHQQLPPWKRENAYLQITEWFAHRARELMIAKIHNHQENWSKFFEEILEEHGFELAERRITHIERPV